MKVKINKTICIDAILLESLEKYNASELINKLLLEHFAQNRNRKLTKIEQKQADFNVYKSKMKKIRREIKVREQLTTLKITDLLINWLKNQSERPYLNDIIEFKRSNDIICPNENIIKAWDIINKHGDIFKQE